MQRYLQQPPYVLSRVSFDYLGAHYEGRGVMTWDPDEGFHIEAPLVRRGPRPRQVVLGAPGVIRETEVQAIRMVRNRSMGWIVAPEVIMRNRLDVLVDERLSVGVGRAVFSEDVGQLSVEPTRWSGSALYRFADTPTLPDHLNHETRIGDVLIERGASRSGILLDSADEQRIVGRLLDEEYLELHYALPMSEWPSASAWRWAEAAGVALAISVGETVRLLRRQIRRRSRRYTEIRKRTEAESLAPFAPLGHDSIVNRDRFITLANFLATNQREANVCRQIFGQIAVASQQRTWQARELLLATTLEAALRTLEGHAFVPGDHTFNRTAALERFRQRYLSDAWTEVCREALSTHDRIRHRNAHPDWLYKETGAMSDDRREEALRDMIFLSRFYGQMILALAGVRSLDPGSVT